MKIAVYGDSFGCINAENIADDKNHSWPHLLRQHPGVEYLKNFSQIGKSFMSTYDDYLKYKSLYDVNIFLVTRIGRIDFPQLKGISRIYFTNKTEVHFSRNEVKNNNLLSEEQKLLAYRLFDYADTYFDVAKNLNHEHNSRKAIIEHSMNLSEYTIFIPCFETHAVPSSPVPLLDIFYFENECLKIDELHGGGKDFGAVVNGRCIVDTRQCHITKENNKLILDKILQAIETKSKTIDLNVDDFVVPTCDIRDCYEWITVPE